MLVALAILAYAASMMTHEALGHGIACLAVGGRNTMLTVWGQACSVGAPAIKAAGPGVQFGAGLLVRLALRLLHRDAAGLRFFLWLVMALDLLIPSGYVAFSGVTGYGDAAELIAGLQPHLAWRAGLILFGAAVYFLSMRAAAFELERFAGSGKRRLFRFVWMPYAAAGVFACCTGAVNRTMEHGVAIGMAAASSFGAGAGLLFLPTMLRGVASNGHSPRVHLRWSAGWGVAAAAVVVVFLFFLEPGLK